MLMFTKKHNELLEIAKEEAYRYGLEKGKTIASEKFENYLKKTFGQYNQTCIESKIANTSLNLKVKNLEKQLIEKNKILKHKYSKEITRYEYIAKRTKKIRIKEKAETKILELKEKELYFEYD